MVFDKIKRAFSGSTGDSEDLQNEYLEVDLAKEEEQTKVLIKLFDLKQYDDVNSILDALREGYTITMIDIKELRKRDPLELKRAVAKIKKTADALEGSIAGFGEHMIIVAPSFAKIFKEDTRPKQGPKSKFD